MNTLKLLAVIAAAGWGYHLWQVHRNPAFAAEEASYSSGDFVPTSMPDQARPHSVFVLAPVNCAANAARTQRANALTQKLTQMGIPVETGTSISFSGVNAQTDIGRSAEMMNGGPPVVFVNGMGKSNPSPEEVAEIFRRTQ